MGKRCSPILDARDLQALGQLCIKNRQDSVIETTAWAQEHFQKPLSVENAPQRERHKFKLYQAKNRSVVKQSNSTAVSSGTKFV